MAKLMLLYENFADAGLLSGGSWDVALTAMQDPRPTKRARSANLDPASTTFRIALTGEKDLRTIALGPTNVTSGAQYQITGYATSAYSSATVDTGLQTVGLAPEPSLDLEWEDDNFWLGVTPIEDPDNAGIWIIHVFDDEESAQYWQIEITDTGNADGFFEIGRLFMGRAYVPAYNFDPNGLTFEPNTSINTAAGGTRYYNRRKAGRRFRFAFPHLPEGEVWTDIYRIQAIANLDKQVFVIPDPDDLEHRNKRSFLGNLSELPSIELLAAVPGFASTGFDIIEAL